jgi:hypothetical protein
MVAQRLHAHFGALGNHYVGVVSTRFPRLHKSELVEAGLGTIPAAQVPLEDTCKRRAHDAIIATRVLPTVTITRSAQGLIVAAMVRRERTELTWEFGLHLVPTTWEIPIGIAVRRVGDVVVLANES